MPKSTKEVIRDGIKEYREVGTVVGGLECALALIETNCDRDDPKVYCAISALSMVVPMMHAVKNALDDPDGLDDEELWDAWDSR